MRLLRALIWVPLFLLIATPAWANGSPDVQLSNTGSNPLFGQVSHVSINASLGAGAIPGYNATFRVVLPSGISYAGGSVVAPTIVHDKPAIGQTTLQFINVSDLVGNSSQAITFDLNHDTSIYDVGDTYTVDTQVFVNSDARYIPQFDANGEAIGSSYTGDASNSFQSTINALKVTKSEPSSEGEILRGVHDHQTVYSLKMENNSINPTDTVVLEDYLPAGLEFLGCGGGSDNTTEAPTNPGSAQEYPGSGLINVPSLSGCVQPSTVATVVTDPDGTGPLPSGVYTHVTWNVGLLAPHDSVTYRYYAAVPLRENTMNWSHSEPTSSSGLQAVNLDNNDGPQTTDEQALDNYTVLSGDYNGAQHETSNDTLHRTAEDLLVHKTVNSPSLVQGDVSTWTLQFKTGEYRYSENIGVTDTLPSGYCPLGNVNYTTGNDGPDSECNPTGAFPSVDYGNVTENANGSFTISWDGNDLSQLAHTTVNDTFTITFPAKTRSRYQNNFLPTTPILANDMLSNNVSLTGSAYSRCVAPGTPDCSTAGPIIDSGGNEPESVVDASSATQRAAAPAIDKQVAASGTDCDTASYTDTVPSYYPGDLVCWKLSADFPNGVDTDTTPILDYLPVNGSFNVGSEHPTANNTTTDVFDGSLAGSNGILSWMFTGGLVTVGGQKFEHVFSTTITPPSGLMANADLKGNLMKFTSSNTAGTAFPLRDQADITVMYPSLSLMKGVKQVNAGPTNGPNVDDVAVSSGDTVTYRVDVTGGGTGDADNIVVWDNLPMQYDCTFAITAISDGGTCVDGGLGIDRIKWTLPSLAHGTTTTLTYKALVPNDLSPGQVLPNTAGVRDYQTSTNTGGHFTYTPANNIDTTNTDSPNVAAIDDASSVNVQNATVVKARSTSVTETGNINTQATIGEKITYTITTTIPHNTSLASDGMVTDTVDSSTRQPYIAGTATATLNGGSLPGSWALDTSGTTPKIIIPDGFTTGASDDIVTLTFQTVVADVAANTRVSGNLTNKATLSWKDAASSNHTQNSTTINTQIVEPLLDQTKSNSAGSNPVTAGQIITYTLTSSNSNAARVSVAHDTVVIDTVPSGITPVDVTDTPLADGAVVPGTGGAIWSTTTRKITGSVSAIDPGDSVVWTYKAIVDNPAIAGSILTNNAEAVTTSLGSPDDAAGERTSTSTNHIGYIATSSSAVTLEGAAITKSADRTTGTIGDKIVYTADVTIPANISLYQLTAIDQLPAGLAFDGYVSASCISGCPAPTVQTYTPVGATTVAWDFGNVIAVNHTRIIRLVYTAHILSTYAGGSSPVVDGDTINNAITINSKTTDPLTPFNPAVIPSSFDNTSDPSTSLVTVHEPHVTLDKAIKVNNTSFLDGPVNVQAGDSFTYQIIVSNTGNSPAYDVVVHDHPDSALTNVVPVSGASFVTNPWTSGNHNIAWKIPGPIAAGDSVTLTYTADPAISSSLHEGQTATNTASISSYYGVSEAQRTTDGFTYREYTGNSDSVNISFHFPALAIVKTTGASGYPDTAPGTINTPFSWRVTVTNTSAYATATDTIITDTLPDHWTYTPGSATLHPGSALEPTVNGQTLTWNVGMINPGDSVIIDFQATPSLLAASNPSNTNSAQASTHDTSGAQSNADGPYQSPVDDAHALIAIPDIDMSIVKSGPATAAYNDTITYTMTVTNHGPSTGHHVVVNDTLPAGLRFISSPDCVSTAGAISCQLGTMSSGSSKDITLNAYVEVGGTQLTNTATVSVDEHDIDPSNNVSSTTVDINPLADIYVHKTGPVSVQAGGDIQWNLTVGNNGPSAATHVGLVDDLPAGLSHVVVTTSAGTCTTSITCDLGTIDTNEVVQITVTATVSPSARGTLSNTAHVTTDTQESELTNNSDTVTSTIIPAPAPPIPNPELSIQKTVITPSPILGGNIKYALQITNSGDGAATNVRITDVLPITKVVFVSAAIPNGSCSYKKPIVVCKLAQLNPGDQAIATVTVRSIVPGEVTNQATVTSDFTDNPANNTDSATVVVKSPATKLVIKKTADRKYVKPGKTVTYTIKVSNTTKRAAYHLRVCDKIPPHTTVVNAHKGTLKNGKVCWKISYLRGNSAKKILLQLRVDRDAPVGNLRNTATVIGPNARGRASTVVILISNSGSLGARGDGGVTG